MSRNHQLPGDMLPATVYYPNGNTIKMEYRPTEVDFELMGVALEQAQQAALAGDSPIGAVLVTSDGELFSAQATEMRENDLTAHAEINAIKKAIPKVGRDLGRCALYTTAEPCLMCAAVLDQGKLGILHIAAMRDEAPEFFREKKLRIHQAWEDSPRTLTVIQGLRKVDALSLLTAQHKRH